MASDPSALLYVLNARGRPTRARSVEEWRRWYSVPSHRQVWRDDVGRYTVSTVFLGMSHSHHRPIVPPMLWEMAIRDEGEPLHAAQFHTRGEARAFHLSAVNWLKQAAAEEESIEAILKAMETPELASLKRREEGRAR